MGTKGFDQVAERLTEYRDKLLDLPGTVKSHTYDIRLKSGQPVTLCGRQGVWFLKEGGGVSREWGPGLSMVAHSRLQEIFLSICGHSVFSHEEEIRQGYVQMDGCRVGLCGTAVLEKGRVKGLRDITSLVFRIPREMPGCSDRLLLSGTDFTQGVLIAGEPGSGKTTLLRDLAAALSTGRHTPRHRLTVLDGRGELSGGFDLGPCADVLKNCPKPQALDMAVRTLSPEIILCDELAPEDLGAVRRSLYAGVGIIATVHAGREEVFRRPLCRKLLDTGAFETLVVLSGRDSPCRIDRIQRWSQLCRRESRAG